ncbi:MAG TPA: hypothetical protein VGY99_30845 [Candidatus Binataceae bacterium]|jgi:hypothetical protein|nr:hypothetical protein [Candidatus Binataceae bacterium]
MIRPAIFSPTSGAQPDRFFLIFYFHFLFIERFDTADLKDAKALLDELGTLAMGKVRSCQPRGTQVLREISAANALPRLRNLNAPGLVLYVVLLFASQALSIKSDAVEYVSQM